MNCFSEASENWESVCNNFKEVNAIVAANDMPFYRVE